MKSANLEQAKVYNDVNSLQGLKNLSRKDKNAALHQTAEQFEAIFMQMVMKSMRDANQAFESDLSGSHDVQFYQEMYDKQLAMHMTSGRGIGLADMMVQQLSQGGENKIIPQSPQQHLHLPIKAVTSVATTEVVKTSEPKLDTPMQFVKAIWHSAVDAAKKLKTDPKVLVAQAALETGWGQRMLKGQDDKPSYNLFNIKAGANWDNGKVEAHTLEYRGKKPIVEKAVFKSYESIDESFKDYVDFLSDNPRYEKALAHSDDPKRFMHELQQAGYATDPQYAAKVTRVLHSDLIASLDKPTVV